MRPGTPAFASAQAAALIDWFEEQPVLAISVHQDFDSSLAARLGVPGGVDVSAPPGLGRS